MSDSGRGDEETPSADAGGPGSDTAVASIRVLHVDDTPDFADLTALYLERQSASMEVLTEYSGSDALTRLDATTVDCLVSDYQMPGMDGLELLEAVRERHPGLPFILFTGKGSEEIASRAISAGVTDYLQKEGGPDQYTVLANRIENAVDRERSRRALAASQRRLSLFIDQSPLGVIEWNEEFEAVQLNDAAEEILGYDEAEFRGSTWKRIVPDSERDRIREVVDAVLDNRGGYRSVNENVRADGQRIVCEWHNRVVTDAADDVVAVFSQFQDVTEREEHKRRLETLISNLPGIVYRCRNDPDWPMEFVGGECEPLTGYEASAIEDGDVTWGTGVIHPDDRERAWDVVQSALDDGDPFQLTYRIVTAGGDLRWVWERGRGISDHSGDPEAIEGFITDVTEQTRHRRRLEERTAVLSALLDHLPVGVLVEDASRQVQRANPTFCDLFDIPDPPSELVGRDCAAMAEAVKEQFVDPEGFVERIDEILDRREPVSGERLELEDGRTLEQGYVPYTLPDGEANLWLYREVHDPAGPAVGDAA